MGEGESPPFVLPILFGSLRKKGNDRTRICMEKQRTGGNLSLNNADGEAAFTLNETKIRVQEKPKKSRSADLLTEGCANSFLDKLAQLRKRGGRKYIQAPIIQQLIAYSEAPKKTMSDTEKARWKKHFERILTCSSVLTVKDGKTTAKYCNSRACLICSAIRTGKLWNKYNDAVKALKEPYFVTLTQGPRVGHYKLGWTINKMIKDFRKCTDVLRKKRIRLVGFRKIETQYDIKKGTFHPHLHIIVDGEYEAYMLMSEWLKHNPKATPKAQNAKPWTENDLNEVFKYITKFFDEDGNVIPPEAMYELVVSMDNKRSFQTFGNFAKGIEEVEDVNEENTAIEIDLAEGYYNWKKSTWFYIKDDKPIIENPTTDNMQKHYNKLLKWLTV